MNVGERRIVRVATVVVCLGAIVAGTIAGTAYAGGADSTGEAIDETELTKDALELANQQLVIGAGSLLVGLSIGIIVAGTITYRRKRGQIRRQLE